MQYQVSANRRKNRSIQVIYSDLFCLEYVYPIIKTIDNRIEDCYSFHEMKRKSFSILVLLIALSFSINLLKADNTSDDPIPYFKLIGVKTEDVDKTELSKLNEKIAAIFIFRRPCLICAKNITYWNRLASIYKGKIRVFGIVLEDSTEKAIDLVDSNTVRFNIYIPGHLERMITTFKANTNQSQTILYRDKAIIYHKTGDLDAQDYFDMSKIIKGE